jgi:hypothetical protein
LHLNRPPGTGSASHRKFCWGGLRSVAFDVALNITQLQQGNGFPDVTATGSRQFSLTYLVPDGLVCE